MSLITGFEERFFNTIDVEVEKQHLKPADKAAVVDLFQRIKGSEQEAEFPNLIESLPLSPSSLKILRKDIAETRRLCASLPEPLRSLQSLALQVQRRLEEDPHTVAENLFFRHDPDRNTIEVAKASTAQFLRSRVPPFEEATHLIKTQLEEVVPLIREFNGDRTALTDIARLARSFSETTDEYARRWARAEREVNRQATFDSLSTQICLNPEAREFYDTLYSELSFGRTGHRPEKVAHRALKKPSRRPEQEPSPSPTPALFVSPAVSPAVPPIELPPAPVEFHAEPPVELPPAPPEFPAVSPVVPPRAKSPEKITPAQTPPAAAPAPETPEATGLNAFLLPEGEKAPELTPTALQMIDKMTEELPGLQRGIVRGYIKARASEQMTEEGVLALKTRALRVSSGLPEALMRYVEVLQTVLGKYAFRDNELSSMAERVVLLFATVPASAVQVKAMLLINALQCLIERPETIRGGYIQDKRDAWKKVMDVLKGHRLWKNALEAVVERNPDTTFVPLASSLPRDFPHFVTTAEGSWISKNKSPLACFITQAC